MKTYAFIFARGGSKGVPGKNIKEMCGKPLIAYTIEIAKKIKSIEKIFVSTEDDNIAVIAREYGANVIDRPPKLALDDSPEWLAWRHALNFLQDTEGALPEVMVLLPTTAPLRFPLDIENCLDAYQRTDVDMIITVTDAHRSPYFNMVKTNADDTVGLVIPPPSSIARRQDAPVVYDMATVCYVANPAFIMSHNAIFEGRIKAVHVPIERAVDIDTLLDFQIAESLLKIRDGEL